jgi:methylated-DNA-[protein]-cysteine S-methyltransferase
LADARSRGARGGSLACSFRRPTNQRPARACNSDFQAHRNRRRRPKWRARDLVVAFLRGEPSDLSSVLLDMDPVPPFHRRVYEATRSIPCGATMTYGALAAQAGVAGAARAVGQALARNPFAIIVPCHRVLAAGGRVGGFSANGGATTKLRLLAIEGQAKGAPEIFDGRSIAARPHRYG